MKNNSANILEVDLIWSRSAFLRYTFVNMFFKNKDSTVR